MLKFNKFLLENIDSKIGKLKNLSRKEKKKVKDFFKRYSTREDEIDWNDETLDITDFQMVFHTPSKSQKKKQVKKKGVKGLTEGIDYIDCSFLFDHHEAFVPLSWEASKHIASKYIGRCTGAWCISYQKDRQYWSKNVERDKLMFVMIVSYDKSEKYSWTINMSGKPVQHYSTTIRNNDWVIYDKKDHMYRKNVVEGENLFRIFRSNKNHLGKYNTLLHKKNKVGKVKNYSQLEGYDDAVSAWETMASDITQYGEHRIEHENEWYDNLVKTITDTKEKYKELVDEAEKKAKEELANKKFENYKDRVDSFKAILRAEPEGTGTDPKTGEPVWHIRGTEPSKETTNYMYHYIKQYPSEINREGIPYTRKELQAFIDTFEKERKRIEAEGFKKPDYTERDEYLKIVDTIESITNPYDIINSWNNEYDGIEWTNDVYEYEYDGYYNYTEFHPTYLSYDDYFEFVKEYNDEIDRYMQDYYMGENGWELDGEEELEYMEFYHPEKVLDKYFEDN